MAIDGRRAEEAGGVGGFACWWSDFYTRGLPSEVSERRRTEIACDVFEQTHAAVDRSPRIAIAWRAARGIPSDLAWRRQEKQTMRDGNPNPFRPVRNTWSVITQAWFAPIAVLLGAFNVLFAIAVATEGGTWDSGNVIGPIVLTILAVSMFGGLWLRWRAGRAIKGQPSVAQPPQTLVSGKLIAFLAAVLVITLALLIVGITTSSVPIFFIALVLIGGTALVFGGRAMVRAVRSSNLSDKVGLADGMIIVGLLPALAMFWMVIPPLMAIAVIVGVVGTGARFRTAASSE